MTVDGKGRITAITDSTTNYVSLDDSITVFVTPQQLSDSISGFSGGDNWGSQYAVLGSDSLLKGKGTTASPLYADSTLLATQYDLTQLPAGFTDPMTTRGISFTVIMLMQRQGWGLGTLKSIVVF